ncbi:hypothetical protein T4D_7159 [Trichinella pseudospiralis]|uniref:Uncharacterized protein n=1 Tax=Trichinella pseudospiralis TaxID=6337 RepID=A0A0V1F4Y9_TRIPS|nr:hypothetical protein T4D_14518 [Trichinella pseudospiralis]KRY81221.1 hypothetical protein T4D_7159 [Trichinella pseudospiralis]
MPRHLISDAYEWINKIPSVPIYYLAKPQPRERAWQNQRGKKTLLSLTLPGTACAVSLWSPMKYHYFDRFFTYSVKRKNCGQFCGLAAVGHCFNVGLKLRL